MASDPDRPPKVFPRWFVHTAWRVHRGLYRISGGRFLWAPSNKRAWGALRLTTVGRRSGKERNVIVGYLEDGPDLVLLVMNGWQEGQPAWFLNVQSRPDVVAQLDGQEPRPVHAVEATGTERERLWELWGTVEPRLDAYAAQRSTSTPIVVLTPR